MYETRKELNDPTYTSEEKVLHLPVAVLLGKQDSVCLGLNCFVICRAIYVYCMPDTLQAPYGPEEEDNGNLLPYERNDHILA